MGWIRLDDDFTEHEKFLRAGPLAGYLMIASIAWSNRNLKDGFIPDAQVPRLVNLDGFAHKMWMGELVGGGEDADAEDLAGDLVDAGLWEPVDGGFRIHDYHDYQPTAARIRAQKGQNAARQARFRDRNADSNAVSNDNVTALNTNTKKEEEKTSSSNELESSSSGFLAGLLADLIQQNGSRRPRISKKWLDAERLLLTADGREQNEAEQVLRWCQADSFWRSNILSMPKFREKYDTLRLHSQRKSPTAVEDRSARRLAWLAGEA